jgi:hypothetical protein
VTGCGGLRLALALIYRPLFLLLERKVADPVLPAPLVVDNHLSQLASGATASRAVFIPTLAVAAFAVSDLNCQLFANAGGAGIGGWRPSFPGGPWIS